jgi:predicted ATPase
MNQFLTRSNSKTNITSLKVNNNPIEQDNLSKVAAAANNQLHTGRQRHLIVQTSDGALSPHTAEAWDENELIFQSKVISIHRGLISSPTSANSVQSNATNSKAVHVLLKRLIVHPPTDSQLQRWNYEQEILQQLEIRNILQPIAGRTKSAAAASIAKGTTLLMPDYGGQLLTHSVGKFYSFVDGTGIPAFLTCALAIVDELLVLHAAGVINRSIRPNTILFNQGSARAQFLDYSYASLLNKERASPEQLSYPEGSLVYISPEETGRNNRFITTQSDLYSLGIVFYELLAGAPPFAETADPLEIIHLHLAKAPPNLQFIHNAAEGEIGLPKIICDIIHRLLAKQVEDRYKTTVGLRLDLLFAYKALCYGQNSYPLEILRLSHPTLATKGLNDSTEPQDSSKPGSSDLSSVSALALSNYTVGAIDENSTFRISQKLYGREKQIKSLLKAFERIYIEPVPEFILISGFSGVGKSKIVDEIHRPIVRQRGIFVKAKFDQFSRNEVTILQAFSSFLNQIMTEEPLKISQWKTQFNNALGSNAGVLCEVLPELSFLLGELPAVPALRSEESQFRFNSALLKFVNVIAKAEHPLTIFLDDLQWVDVNSVNLLRLLFNQERCPLILIGAYRDNEVNHTHILMRLINELKIASAAKQQTPSSATVANTAREDEKMRAESSEPSKQHSQSSSKVGVSSALPLNSEQKSPDIEDLENYDSEELPDTDRVKIIRLKALKLANVERLVADSFNVEEEMCRGLAHLLFQKTQGNPMYINQILHSYYGEKLIYFDFSLARWNWQLNHLKFHDLGEDVVDLLCSVINKFGHNEQNLIKLMAALGDQFTLGELLICSELNPIDTARTAWKLVESGLIIPVGGAEQLLLAASELFRGTTSSRSSGGSSSMDDNSQADAGFSPSSSNNQTSDSKDSVNSASNSADSWHNFHNTTPHRGNFTNIHSTFLSNLELPEAGNFSNSKALLGNLTSVFGKLVLRFSHDRVQQSAIRLIPEGERPAKHLQIARALVKNLSDDEIHHNIIELTAQFNLGAKLIGDADEAKQVISLNLIAARRAKLNSRYEVTTRRLETALELLQILKPASNRGLMTTESHSPSAGKHWKSRTNDQTGSPSAYSEFSHSNSDNLSPRASPSSSTKDTVAAVTKVNNIYNRNHSHSRSDSGRINITESNHSTEKSDLHWIVDYKLSLAVYRELSECRYLRGEYLEAEELIAMALSHAQSALDKANLYELRMQSYFLQHKLNEAKITGWKALEELKVELSTSLPQWAIKPGGANDSCVSILDTDRLLSLPEMKDPSFLAAMRVLSTMALPAYSTVYSDFTAISTTMVRLSLEEGISSHTAFALACYCVVLVAADHFQAADTLGSSAILLLERLDNKQARSKVCTFVYGFVYPYTKSLKETVHLLEETSLLASECGDVQASGTSLMFVSHCLFISGQPLNSVLTEMNYALDLFSKRNQLYPHLYVYIWRKNVLQLLGEEIAADYVFNNNDPLTEEQLILTLESADSSLFLFSFYLGKAIQNYLKNDFTAAFASIQLAQKYRSSVLGLVISMEFDVYYCLILLENIVHVQNIITQFPILESIEGIQYPTTSHTLQQLTDQQSVTKHLLENRVKLDTVAELLNKLVSINNSCNANFATKLYLIEAIRQMKLRDNLTNNDKRLAMNGTVVALFEKALKFAKQEKQLHLIALILEKLGRFDISVDYEAAGHACLDQSYTYYAQWVAKTKLLTMEQEFPSLKKFADTLHQFELSSPDFANRSFSNMATIAGHFPANVQEAATALPGEWKMVETDQSNSRNSNSGVKSSNSSGRQTNSAEHNSSGSRYSGPGNSVGLSDDSISTKRAGAGIAPALFQPGAINLELHTLFKAVQAFSAELQLDRLLQQLMLVILQHAGASLGHLALQEEQNKWTIRVSANLNPTNSFRNRSGKNVDTVSAFTIDAGMPLQGLIPLSIFNRVHVSKQSIVLTQNELDSDITDWLSTDPYFHLHKPKSLACIPVVAQSRLVGVLYLENEFDSQAFSASHIQILQLLCSQAALSIENARLVARLEHSAASLEQRIVARESEIKEKNKYLEAAQLAAKSKSDFLSNMSHGEPQLPILGQNRVSH